MKRATQVDVARRAGVSRATVSYVLNDHTDGRVPISDETRRRVIRMIEELGYEPDARAQALRSGASNALGLILPDLSNPHYAECAIGIEEQPDPIRVQISSQGFDVRPHQSVTTAVATPSSPPDRRVDSGELVHTRLGRGAKDAESTAQTATSNRRNERSL